MTNTKQLGFYAAVAPAIEWLTQNAPQDKLLLTTAKAELLSSDIDVPVSFIQKHTTKMDYTPDIFATIPEFLETYPDHAAKVANLPKAATVIVWHTTGQPAFARVWYMGEVIAELSGIVEC